MSCNELLLSTIFSKKMSSDQFRNCMLEMATNHYNRAICSNQYSQLSRHTLLICVWRSQSQQFTKFKLPIEHVNVSIWFAIYQTHVSMLFVRNITLSKNILPNLPFTSEHKPKK